MLRIIFIILVSVGMKDIVEWIIAELGEEFSIFMLAKTENFDNYKRTNIRYGSQY